MITGLRAFDRHAIRGRPTHHSHIGRVSHIPPAETRPGSTCHASPASQIIAAATARALAIIEKDRGRNKWLDAHETIEYDIPDPILERVPNDVEG